MVLPHAAARYAAEQRDGVRVARILEDRLDGSLFDEAPGVENPHPGAHLGDHAEVVADEEHGRVELGLQTYNQIQYLRLDGRVESRRRLVEDEQCGIFGQRHRDHDALLHAARELMRKAPEHAVRVGDLHASEHLQRPVSGLLSARIADGEDLRELPSDAERRIEGGAGVLVHHRDGVGTEAAQVALPELPDVAAIDEHRARANAAVAGQIAHRRQRRGRLSAPGLPDEPVALP